MASDTPPDPYSLQESMSYFRGESETSRTRLVSSPEQAADNIVRYRTEIEDALFGMELKRRMKRVNAWYAVRSEDGSWLFAPSKYVGYSQNTAAAYLAESGERDGRKTERVLADWFHVVSADSRRGGELAAALQRFMEAHGHSGPKQDARICVLREVLEELDEATETQGRIRVDAEICGGRPHVRGTRVRVSDILQLMAAGVAPAEILADYPYLEEADLRAALAWGAAASEHRIVHAA